MIKRTILKKLQQELTQPEIPILLKDRIPIPIEVKSKITSLDIPSGLKRFLNRNPDVELAYIINEQNEEEIKRGDCSIRFFTFEKFSKHFQIE